MSDPQKQPPPRAELTRVPVKRIWFSETVNFDGMGSDYTMMSNVQCGKQQENATRWVTADWVPAWLTFVMTFHNNGSTYEQCLPLHMVKRWVREEPPR